MDPVQTSEELLYCTLPKFFVHGTGDCAPESTSQTPGSNFGSSFLADHLPKHRLRRNEHDVDPHQGFMLDNAARKSKGGQCHTTPYARGIKPLSSNKLRRTGLYQVPKDLKYEDLVPLHTLWLQYMAEVFHFRSGFDPQSTEVQNNLLKADFHGCHLSVLKSKCPSYVGIEGILIQETQNAMKIVTRSRGVKTVPKKGSVFVFELHEHEFRLFGSHFMTKPADRASKKFKTKQTIDL